MKVRIYKTGDEVIVDCPSVKYQEVGIERCPHPGRFRNGESFEVEVMEMADVEAIATNNEAGSGQFYYDGTTLKHDDGWNEILMPLDLITMKHRARLVARADAELDKDSPDPIVVARLERDKRKIKDKTDKEMYQQALDNLDEDGHQKPKIRQKLQEKIG